MENQTQHIVKRSNGRDLKFSGELLASAESSANNASGNYSGSVGRWTELNLFKTKAGKFVCNRIEYTQWQGERHSHEAVVCGTVNEVIDFYGSGWLAKQLYRLASIDASEEIS